MAEPTPLQPNVPEVPKPQSLVVDETPVFFSTPQQIEGQDITSFTILGANKRAPEGVGSIVPLIEEPSRKKGEEGTLINKPLTNLNSFDEVPWDKLSGVQWTDASGNAHVIPKDALSLSEPANEMAPDMPEQELAQEPVVETAPIPPEKPPALAAKEARGVLEQLKENPNIVTIVGLKAYETRALTLADRSMQSLSPVARERAEAGRTLWEKTKDAANGVHEFVFNTIWKKSIGGIYFHEKSRQYYLDMLTAAETPFAEDAIRVAERRATDLYNRNLADANFLTRVGTKAADWLKDKAGMRTTIQTLALDEISRMKTGGEIRGMETLEREAKAVRLRFGQDMDNADAFVRTQLGEKLEILDPENEEYKPLTEGIRQLIKEYATGEIPDRETFNQKTQEFFAATLTTVRPDIFAEAELYSSSLFDAAETLKTKLSHEAGMANLDQEMANIQIRLGLGQMGEVTSLEPTAVEKGVGQVREVFEWLNKKNILVPMVFNEAAIGSGVAIALSAANFFKTLPARALVPLGGGILAGGAFAGWREYGQLQKDFMTHLRERETGAQFTETQKRRNWFERFSINQRSVDEMIKTIHGALYEQDADTGNLIRKATITDDELRTAMATIADLHARKAVSESGPKRIGLIRYSNRDAIESERTALDVTAQKALTDLESYFASLPQQEIPGPIAEPLPEGAQAEESPLPGGVLGGNTFAEFMEKLTVAQTDILRTGAGTPTEDALLSTLDLSSTHVPEAALIRRRWPFAARSLSDDEKAIGIDAILTEFQKEAKVEAVKYGVKAGVISAGVGAVIHGIGDVLAHKANIGETVHETIKNINERLNPTPPEPDHFNPDMVSHPHTSEPVLISFHNRDTHVLDIDGHGQYELPDQLTINTVDREGHIYHALFTAPDGHQITLGDDRMNANQLIHTLEKAGFQVQENHADAVVASATHDTVIPLPSGNGIPTKLPEGFEWKYMSATHSFNLVDTTKDVNHSVVASGIHFDAQGKMTDADMSSLTQQMSHAYPGGYEIHNAEYTMRPITAAAERVETPVSLSHEITLQGDDIKDGMWQHFVDHSKGENSMATANGMKNLFRLYVHDNKDAIDLTGSAHEGYFDNDAHTRIATLGSLGETREIDISRIPLDAKIHLPDAVFGQHGIDQFHDISNAGIKHINEMVASGQATGPMDAINKLYEHGGEDKVQAIVLRLGYVGQDGAMLHDKADLDVLYTRLGATTSEQIASPAHVDMVETLKKPMEITLHEVQPAHAARIVAANGHATVSIPYMSADYEQRFTAEVANRVQEATSPLAAQASEGAFGKEEISRWIPVFIPYRASLEAPLGDMISTAPFSRESMLSPTGFEDMYLTREALNARTSPKLKETPDAVLSQQEELAHYLSELPAEDKEILDSAAVKDMPAMAPETRAVVLIPASQFTNVSGQLSGYTNQTNADGSPLAPKTVEYFVYEPTIKGQEVSAEAAQVRADVEQFQKDHQDMTVRYVSHEYDTQPTVGRVKRDMSNITMSRIAALPQDAKDVYLFMDKGNAATVQPTYLSGTIDAMDADASIDMTHGAYELPQEAYANHPMLFTQQRMFEVMDALVRHGDADQLPGIYVGNTGVRASTLAAVGGYNALADRLEDREVSWMIRTARGTADTQKATEGMKAVIDPKETVYAYLQGLGLADADKPLTQNETYKDMSWQDMATKAQETYTQDHLQAQLNSLYENMYPTLKSQHPERFDAYFKRSMDTLGITYEITDGVITVKDTERLAANMAAPIDMEQFASDAAKEVVEATPSPAQTSRETLSTIAGEQTEEETKPLERNTFAATIKSPELEEPVSQEPGAEVPTETMESTIEQPEQTGAMSHGIEERVSETLKSHESESQATVEVTPAELMDYIKSTVDIGGTRITDGTVTIDGNTVKLKDMKADVYLGKARLGETTFSSTLVTDETNGLTVDRKSVKMHVPLIMRLQNKHIHNQLDDFSHVILSHMGERIDPAWKPQRIDVVGDKLQVSFTKTAPAAAESQPAPTQ